MEVNHLLKKLKIILTTTIYITPKMFHTLLLNVFVNKAMIKTSIPRFPSNPFHMSLVVL